MKQFLTVLKFELNNYFKNKSFVITTLVLVLLIVGVIVVPTLIPGLLGPKESDNGAETAEELENLGIFVNTEEVEDVESLLSYLPVLSSYLIIIILPSGPVLSPLPSSRTQRL